MLTTETIGTLSEVAAKLPALNGRRVHSSTLWRWATRGINGVRLESRRLGGRLITSIEAVERFSHQLAEQGVRNRGPVIERSTAPRRRSPKQRARDIETAKAELREAGVK